MTGHHHSAGMLFLLLGLLVALGAGVWGIPMLFDICMHMLSVHAVHQT